MTSQRRILRSGSAAIALMWAAASAQALPTGATTNGVSAGGFTPVVAGSGQTMTVDVRANRTIIDWSSFNIASGETVTFAFNFGSWVALNRVASGPISIDGQLNAIVSPNPQTPGPRGGNIWLYSPAGVAFGPNARVDVGGLLATSSAPDPSGFLVSASLSHTLTGDGAGGPVTVAGGAQMTAGGHLSFLAPRVTTGAGAVFVGTAERSTITYAAADTYDIRFTLITGGDMALLDFVVPSAAVGTVHTTPLDLAGHSRAGNVYLLATGRDSLASILINAPGLMEARSSTALQGKVKIASGRQMTNADFDFQQEVRQVPGAPPGSVIMGTAVADSYITIVLAGDRALGDFTAEGLTAGATIGIGARNVTIGPGGLTMRTSGLGEVDEDDITIDASGTVTIPNAFSSDVLAIFRGVHQTGRSTTRPNIQLGSATADDRLGLFGAITVTGPLAAGNLIEGNFGDLRATSMTAPAIALNGLGAGAPLRIGTLTTSGPLTLNTSGPVELGTATVSGDALVRASEFSLTGGLAASNFTLEAAEGTLGVGGVGAGLSDAEFQRIRVSGAVNLYGGVTSTSFSVPTAVYGDVTLRDLSVDPTRVPKLNLFAHNSRNVIVSGTVRPTASGGAVRIGDATANSIWLPDQIRISGALGSASGDALAGFTDVRAFGSVDLRARRNILIGSERYNDLVDDADPVTIDVAAGQPLGAAPTLEETGKLFVVAGSLAMGAGERVVQQNTGGFGGERGFYLTGDGVSAEAPILSVGGAQVVDVFGTLRIGEALVSGQQAVTSGRIARLEGDLSTGEIRINGCQLGLGCRVFTPAQQFRLEQFRPASAAVAVDPPVLSPPPAMDEDERETHSVTTGAGNEEIWRRPR